MVFEFFRGGEDGLELVENEIVSMVGSCRHSFDLAMGALVTDADLGPLGEQVRENDRTINAIEEGVRRQLVVHMAVHGGADVGAVLASLLIVKKLERVGDQAKNIFDLADEGVRFSGADDYEDFMAYRAAVSDLFAETASVLADPDPAVTAALDERAEVLTTTFQRLVTQLLHTDEPGHRAVPRAMLYRYLKRICANLANVAHTTASGIDRSADATGDG